MHHSLSCACATNCFAYAQTIALRMRTLLPWLPHLHEPCACHCFAHAQAIALRMRAPLLCACAGHYTAHVHNSQTCSRGDDFLSRNTCRPQVSVKVFPSSHIRSYSPGSPRLPCSCHLLSYWEKWLRWFTFCDGFCEWLESHETAWFWILTSKLF